VTPNPDINGTPLFDVEIAQKRYKIDTWLVQTTDRKWYVACWIP